MNVIINLILVTNEKQIIIFFQIIVRILEIFLIQHYILQ